MNLKLIPQFRYAVILSCVTSLSVAHAELVVGEAQFNEGDVLPDPIIAVSGDLLETSVALATGENPDGNPRDGLTGTAQEQSETAPAEVWRQVETIYELDLNSSPGGYHISEVLMFSGWRDGRAGQSYSLSYSLVGDDAWVELGIVSELRSNGSLLTRTYDDAGGLLASGVDAIRITFIDEGNAGSGTVLREIDLIGSPVTSTSQLPEITDISYDTSASTVTLTWSSQVNATYTVKYSVNLADFDSNFNDSVTVADDEILDDGNQITMTFNLAEQNLENAEKLFFRVEF